MSPHLLALQPTSAPRQLQPRASSLPPPPLPPSLPAAPPALPASISSPPSQPELSWPQLRPPSRARGPGLSFYTMLLASFVGMAVILFGRRNRHCRTRTERRQDALRRHSRSQGGAAQHVTGQEVQVDRVVCEPPSVSSSTLVTRTIPPQVQVSTNRGDGDVAAASGADGEEGDRGVVDPCPICLEELLPGDIAVLLPCNHGNFHASCMQAWLVAAAARPTCPLCKAEVPRDA